MARSDKSVRLTAYSAQQNEQEGKVDCLLEKSLQHGFTQFVLNTIREHFGVPFRLNPGVL
jgi:hypothetical protein